MLTGSLYHQYIEERSNGRLIENEHGFIAYRMVGPECFIMDMFISPGKRKSGEGRKLIEKLSEIAIENGCTLMTAEVQLADPGASNTLIGCLRVGFKVARSNGVALLIVRELGA